MHPLETAIVLADLKLDADALAAALLHDVVEDSDDILVQDIRDQFGEDIARLVDGVTKLTGSRACGVGQKLRRIGGTYAGRDDSQDDDGYGARYSGRPDKAGRPPSQYEDYPVPVEGQAHREGAGNAAHIRAARPQAWYLGDEVAVGGPVFPADPPAEYKAISEGSTRSARRERNISTAPGTYSRGSWTMPI